jgi:NDP-sugar pyrophosphorylase family protein
MIMAKQRLTITLDSELLKRLDNIIDGSKIRNRSHAIEFLLSSSLVPKKTKVLILAGGEGVKFRPLTYELPKSLIPIQGKPLLEHTLESLRDQGFSDIYISIGHLGEKIRDYFGDGSRFGINIRYLEQKSSKRGTAQPVLLAKSYLGSSPFLIIYGDVLTKLNFFDLVEFHNTHKGVATVALASVEKTSMWGVATIQGNRIVNFVEKPKIGTKSHLINAGIYVLDPKVFKYISPDSVRLERDLFPRLAAEGRLYAYPSEADWFDVSTPEVYAEVIKEWR